MSGRLAGLWDWSEAEHDERCENGGCPGYAYHRLGRYPAPDRTPMVGVPDDPVGPACAVDAHPDTEQAEHESCADLRIADESPRWPGDWRWTP